MVSSITYHGRPRDVLAHTDLIFRLDDAGVIDEWVSRSIVFGADDPWCMRVVGHLAFWEEVRTLNSARIVISRIPYIERETNPTYESIPPLS